VKNYNWSTFFELHGIAPFWNGLTFTEFNQQRIEFCRTHFIPKNKKVGISEKDPKNFLFKLFSLWENDCTPVLLPFSATQSERLQFFKTAPYHYLWEDQFYHLSDLEFKAPREEVLILFSSGSSGSPKGISLSAENLYASAQGSLEFYQEYLNPTTKWEMNLPLHHIGGLMIPLRALIAGHQLTTGIGTVTSMVPTQLIRALKEKDTDSLTKYQLILLGGAGIPVSLLKQAYQLGLKISPTYGLTETTAQVCAALPSDCALNAGGPLPHQEIRVVDGIIQVKSSTISAGQYRDGKFKQHCMDEGFFSTKDLGLFSNSGLDILGRNDGQFISGGENISPTEIENFVLTHPEIIQAVVVPKTHSEFGNCPVLYYQTRNQQPLVCNDLKTFCSKGLSPYKVPKKFIHGLLQFGLKPSRQKLIEAATGL
jgi:o-succinylbenzoate---CoA ligase